MARWVLFRAMPGEAVSAAPPRAGFRLLLVGSQHTRCKTFALWRGVLRPPSIPPEKPRSGSVRGYGVRPPSA